MSMAGEIRMWGVRDLIVSAIAAGTAEPAAVSLDLEHASATAAVMPVTPGAFGAVWVLRFLVLDRLQVGPVDQGR